MGKNYRYGRSNGRAFGKDKLKGGEEKMKLNRRIRRVVKGKCKERRVEKRKKKHMERTDKKRRREERKR